tara:strand:+ start:262 stop:1002 length:741 start_codon:yes stop_codon:yes gene_type:complete
MDFSISYGGAALAGLLSFFSPCVLPLVPFYLCYLAGITMEEFRNEGAFSNTIRKKLLLNTVFFSLGIVTIFMMMGLAASTIGQIFREYRSELSILAAIILTIFAIHFLGLLKFSFLYREFRISSSLAPSRFLGSYVMGLVFGFGWTPCVGPALAAVLFIAADKDSLLQGALLLATYGIFMTFPFVLASLFSQPFLSLVQRNRSSLAYLEKSMGVFLLVFAALIASNNVSIISIWLMESFPIFAKIG